MMYFDGLPDCVANDLVKEFILCVKDIGNEEGIERTILEGSRTLERIDIDKWVIAEQKKKEKHEIVWSHWKANMDLQMARDIREVDTTERSSRTGVVVKEERARQTLTLWRVANQAHAKLHEKRRILEHAEEKIRRTLLLRESKEWDDLIDMYVQEKLRLRSAKKGPHRKELVGVFGQCPFLDAAVCPMTHVVQCMDPEHVRPTKERGWANAWANTIPL